MHETDLGMELHRLIGRIGQVLSGMSARSGGGKSGGFYWSFGRVEVVDGAARLEPVWPVEGEAWMIAIAKAKKC